ncbi:MAG: hypothetical protein HYY16_13035 [Planctomycetes bacterium]|nr:hypothetical protein [Planctomycetota bacterium]
MRSTLGCVILSCVCALAAACRHDDSDDDNAGALTGAVLSAEGSPIPGATVYLVPTTVINQTQITGAGVYSSPYPAEAYDEPLEDAVAASGPTFSQTATDAAGQFTLSSVPDGNFFVYVAPPAGDTEHLPGGSTCKSAYSAGQLRGASMTIKLSSSPSASATYTGTAGCLVCHPTYVTEKTTAHKIGIMPIGAPGAEQDASKFPSFFNGLTKFKSTATYAGGTRLELGDYDPTRSFDKFKIREFGDTQMPITTVYANLYLWKSTGDGKYYITIDNMLNGGDPNDLTNLEVRFTYGGAVYKQRYLVAIPPALDARNGTYFTLQYNIEGNDTRWNRARRVWRDYKFSNFWSAGVDATYGNGDDVIVAPPITQTFEGECAACHFTGYQRYTDSITGEYRARAANNASGEADIDDDVGADELNIGCEVCHGPGSEHAAAASARYIVAQRYLTPERENVTCGRCHDRPKGKTGNEQPINDVSLEMMRPGQSRATFLSSYCSTSQKGPNPSSELWSDGLHSKTHHQQYSDLLKSKHYKNDRRLVVCADCHDPHGGTSYRHQLLTDPDDNNSFLCQTCHTVDTLSHLQTKTGTYMTGMSTLCADCHMPKTVQSGSGRYGAFLVTPPYTSSTDEGNKAYWENDISSHLFQVPRKTHVDVAGKTPGNAMVTPYTNSCGICHDVSQLPYP